MCVRLLSNHYRRQIKEREERIWNHATQNQTINPDLAANWQDLVEESIHEWHNHAPLKWNDEAVPGCPSCSLARPRSSWDDGGSPPPARAENRPYTPPDSNPDFHG